MRVNTAFVGTYYTAASSKQTEEAGGSYEAFMSAVEAVKEAHKLTPTNIKQEDDWRKMTDREWDKLVEHIDRVLEAERENLEELKDLQAQAEQKAAANAPASMKSIMAGQAALKVAANGYFAGFTSGKEATELEKSSWTYDLETDDQVLLAKAKLANERAADALTEAQEIALFGVGPCPYSYMAKDGIIKYNGVTFVCDYKHNAITLGDVTSDPKKVLNINLPSGGRLSVNVDNLDDLARASGMFTPADLKAIMQAIETYKHCTKKQEEIEETESTWIKAE